MIQGEEARHDEALQRFVREVGGRYGDWVQDLILFGSRARGTAGPGSDWDLLAIVDRKDRERESSLVGLAFDYLISDRINLSVKWVTRDIFDLQLRLGVPFAKNVERDGRNLWTRTTTS